MLANRTAKTPSSSTRNQKKTVRFNPKCDGLFIRYPSAEENKERWYSKEDEMRMKSERTRDAVACSYLLFGGSVGRECQAIVKTRDFLICCTGLDRFMCTNVPQRFETIERERMEHVDAVLEEQKKQRQRNARSIFNLARVSKVSSRMSRKQARRVAKLTARI